MTEEKKIRFQIARLESTHVCNVFIDKVEELGENERFVYATVKFYKTRVKVQGESIVESCRVV